MKVFTISNSNNSSPPTKGHKIAFEAGLTNQIMQEIQNADVLVISNKLAQRGINTDFKGNKIIAWCCNKTVEILDTINKNFKQKLALPEGIFVEDFKNLNDNPTAIGTCNMLPSRLKKNSDEIILEKVIFFNSNVNWENIDAISDLGFEKKQIGSDFFMYSFFHEFSHVLHLDNLMKNFDNKTLMDKVKNYIKNKELISNCQGKYKNRISSICDNAIINPFESVAYDIPNVIIRNLNKESLSITKNPFIGTPYDKLSFWQRVNIPDYSDEKRPLDEILRRFWNGKFD